MHRRYCLLSATIFAVVAFVHLVRLLAGWEFRVGPFALPPAGSLAGLVAAAALSGWGFRAALR